MNYPLISEYVEAIKAPKDNFKELNNLRPVLGEDGEPVMTSGNFSVVFKMKDELTGKLHAVKCFLKEQEGRAEAYRQIAEELEFVSSTFLTPIKYLDKELFVDSSNSDETDFPVLLMDWVEGQTLDMYIREHIDDQYELSMLAYQFSRLAMWLMPQPFAHGDLKPDNILVKEDGALVLVDYDGMYVPAMKGQKARELGSPDFRHPGRTEDDFDEHIDDFSLASILLSLKAIALQPNLLEGYGASDRLLFSEKDNRNIIEASIWFVLISLCNKELDVILSAVSIAFSQKQLSEDTLSLICLKEPEKDFFIKGRIPHSTLCKMGIRKAEILYEGFARVFDGQKWGCLDKNGEFIIPCLYDIITMHIHKDSKSHILCAHEGMSFSGWHGSKEETIYTGIYDLYDNYGDFLIGGFNDYEYDEDYSIYKFLFGRQFKLIPKAPDKPWSKNRFHLSNRGKWIVLGEDFVVPFDFRLQYIDVFTCDRFTSKHSLKGGLFYLKDNILYGEFKRYAVPIAFPIDVLFDKISVVNKTTILGINHPSCANEERSVIYLNSHIKTNYYKWTNTIDEHYTFVYQGRLGLLKDGKEVLPCEFEYVTKPINDWSFVVKKYPYIPDKCTWDKYYVLLHQIKDCYHSDFQFRNSLVAIRIIDKEIIEELLCQGAFLLSKVGEDRNSLKSYALMDGYQKWFEKNFIQQLHEPQDKKQQYYYNYWMSSELMEIMKKGLNNNFGNHDNYGLMDALDGNPDAYWNID